MDLPPPRHWFREPRLAAHSQQAVFQRGAPKTGVRSVGTRNLWIALFTLLVLPSLTRASSPDQPNILLLIADDIGNDLIGIYNEGDPAEQPPTPNIDWLASQGMRFTNFWTYPSCSPTRATMLTGRYGTRNGVTAAIKSDGNPFFMPFSEWTIPEVMKAAQSDYTSILLGKWHLGAHFQSYDPVAQGFDWFFGTPRNLEGYYSYEKFLAGPGIYLPLMDNTYATSSTVNDLEIVLNCLPDPWFSWTAFHAAHGPLHDPPPELHTQALPLDTDTKQFQAMIEAMDHEIGRALQSVDLTTTIVIFLSDNGTRHGLVSSSPLGNAKGSVAEGGINTSLIIAGPCLPAELQGSISDALVNSVDLFPAILELMGIDAAAVLPQSVVLDGTSFVPLLTDPNAQIRPVSFAEVRNPLGGPFDEEDFTAARDERYKLRIDRLTGDEFFFDMDAAPPGADGVNLCPCPFQLPVDGLSHYLELKAFINDLE